MDERGWVAHVFDVFRCATCRGRVLCTTLIDEA